MLTHQDLIEFRRVVREELALASGGKVLAPATLPDQTLAIPKKIADMREARGWTMDTLAAAVGVSRQAVANWERGKTGITARHTTRLADVFGVPPENLQNNNAPEATGASQAE